jgi:hypothetical protein
MNPLRFFIPCIVIASSLANSSDSASPYKDQAKTWAESLSSASAQELEYVVTLVYWSWARSYSTLEAQNSSLQFLDLALQSMQAITATRLDPSQPITDVGADLLHRNFNRFQYARQLHRRCGQVYTHAVHLIVDGNTLPLSEYCKKSISFMRANARQAMTSAATQVTELPTAAYDFAKNNLQKFLSLACKQQHTKSFGQSFNKLLQKVGEKIPQFLLAAVIKAEKHIISTQADCHQALYLAHQASSLLWDSIEKQRTSFYLGYYESLYETVRLHHLDNAMYITDFSNNKILLPKPQELEQSLLTFYAD